MIIVDLDNCIADDRWRQHLIRWEQPQGFRRYHDYHMAIPGDQPENLSILAGQQTILFTSRPQRYEWLTREWLSRHGIKYNALYMRSERDWRPSPETKRDMLKSLGLLMPLSKIVMAYDDRDDVLAMYRGEGLPTTRMAIHAFTIEEHTT